MNPFHRTTLGLSEKDRKELRSMQVTPPEIAEQIIEGIVYEFAMECRTDWLTKSNDAACQAISSHYERLEQSHKLHPQAVRHDCHVLVEIATNLMKQRMDHIVAILRN